MMSRTAFFFLLPLCFSFPLAADEITTYGQQYEFIGIIQQFSSFELGIDINQNYPEQVPVICLTQPIKRLPLPDIPGNLMHYSSGVEMMILYFPSEFEKRQIQVGKPVHIIGSIWYADWLSETNPLLLIVDRLEMIN